MELDDGGRVMERFSASGDLRGGECVSDRALVTGGGDWGNARGDVSGDSMICWEADGGDLCC